MPSYRRWDQVPKNLHTRTSALREKVVIPADAKPDAVKNAATTLAKDKDKIYFLYNINKYKQQKHELQN